MARVVELLHEGDECTVHGGWNRENIDVASVEFWEAAETEGVPEIGLQLLCCESYGFPGIQWHRNLERLKCTTAAPQA
eukprot:scaffold87462_cov19-Tisochrysis_lutea.AAC.2